MTVIMNANSGLTEICSLLSSMYLCKPSKEAIYNWKTLVAEGTSIFLRDMKAALEGINAESEEEVESLIWEYTRLFIGPYKLPCPPWESVYASPKRLMMQESADEVRRIYDELGLTVDDPGVMPDHIGAELNFLALLFHGMHEEGENEAHYINLAERLVNEHLLQWVPQFARDMEDASDMLFYKTLARTTRKLLDLIGV